MPLNEDGVPCMSCGVWEIIGKRKVQIGIRKEKTETGEKEIIVYEDKPVFKQYIRLVPAEQRGWRKTIVFEKPIYNNRAGRWELVQHTINRDRFVCLGCKTSRNMLLKQMGWGYELNIPHHGGGIVHRCFKCDVTVGPFDVGEYGESEVIKRDLSRKEVIAVIKKYGLDIPFPPR